MALLSPLPIIGSGACGRGGMFCSTSLIMFSARSTASFLPAMCTIQGSLPLSMSTLAPLFSWISLICRPPGPMSLPVQLGWTSMVACASPMPTRSRPSRTSTTRPFAVATFSGVPEKRTRHFSLVRSMLILAPLRSCSSWILAPPAPMSRPTAVRGISMNSPSLVGGWTILVIISLAASTCACMPTSRTRQTVAVLSMSTCAPLVVRTSAICCPLVPMILPATLTGNSRCTSTICATMVPAGAGGAGLGAAGAAP
mmetsp:Transcript_136090/g.379319  ORF Transcript_136090/g.379319 Transcript_136090/m.379319 type:complete len:255 (+) Transcript_136090:491-1255(+)